MTYKEAHRFLEDLQRKYTRDRDLYKPEFIEANGLAILALEKQIPKKRILKEDILGFMVSTCPYCGEPVHNNFCRICGQAIDWGDLSDL